MTCHRHHRYQVQGMPLCLLRRLVLQLRKRRVKRQQLRQRDEMFSSSCFLPRGLYVRLGKRNHTLSGRGSWYLTGCFSLFSCRPFGALEHRLDAWTLNPGFNLLASPRLAQRQVGHPLAEKRARHSLFHRYDQKHQLLHQLYLLTLDSVARVELIGQLVYLISSQ